MKPGARRLLRIFAVSAAALVLLLLALPFLIPLDKVRVIDPFVGGGFGCKGSAWSHVVLAARQAGSFWPPRRQPSRDIVR